MDVFHLICFLPNFHLLSTWKFITCQKGLAQPPEILSRQNVAYFDDFAQNVYLSYPALGSKDCDVFSAKLEGGVKLRGALVSY